MTSDNTNPPTADNGANQDETQGPAGRAVGARIALGLALPAVIAAAAIIPWLVTRDDLPARVATHYNGSGTPDDSMTVVNFGVFTGLLSASGIAMLLGVGLMSRRIERPLAVIGGFLGGFLGGLGAGIFGGELVTQQGNATWQDADSPWTVLLWTLLLAGALGALAARLAWQLPAKPSRVGEPATPEILDLGPGEHAVWVSSLRSNLMLGLGVALFVAGIVFAVLVPGVPRWLAFVGFALPGLAVTQLGTIRVRTDHRGMTVRYGLIPWPRTDLAIEDIDRATVIDVRPAEWGGWGYRGTLALMRQAAVVLRAGPGIRVDLKNDKVFVVTVDDPGQGAALLNTEVSRRVAPGR